ncbi:hypothetical protein P6144_00225 [Sphingomonas sp. HITSZ_GF]|uniref:hypothetical protein n=1 Tax=Sphingomonas sp. HITSZ_GF TaxID=3037247 RepID=UPI00240D9D0C|nr:hypothetical protein [Sphingomonas sp. HITSZ_GF]MDG2532061.1 hypothetical protein [Sphingomonas sp. HITSZ_GF]
MKSGRRIANPKTKQMAGTYRKDRHGDIAPIAATPIPTGPKQPAYLTPEGKLVWAEEINRVTALGATEADSSAFARYCEMEAHFRLAIMAGDDFPTGVMLTELRRYAELFGIAGLRSRLAKIGTAEPVQSSPYQIRKK